MVVTHTNSDGTIIFISITGGIILITMILFTGMFLFHGDGHTGVLGLDGITLGITITILLIIMVMDITVIMDMDMAITIIMMVIMVMATIMGEEQGDPWVDTEIITM